MQVSPEELTETNLGLVRRVVHQRRRSYLDIDDAFQEGAMALVRAARRYDPSRGIRFSTYAMAAIHNALSLAEERPRRWREKEASLDTLCRDTDPDGNRLVDVLPDAGAVNPEAAVVHQGQRSELESALDQLPAREAEILRLRYGFITGEPMSCQQVARYLGTCSRVRINQVEQQALRRLRQILRT